MKKHLIGVACLFCLSCGNNDADRIQAEALKAIEQQAQQKTTQPVLPEPEQVIATDHIEPTAPPTKMDFGGKERFEFGTIKEGDKVTHDFEFKNTGDQPLIITTCKASCGCTVPQWTKAPILPQQTDKIHVVFDSKHKNGEQLKAITITANTRPTRTVIYVAGRVEK
jgi:Protein of unknown function (DUF1573)